MRRWTVAVLLALSLSAHAQSFWDGNAALLRGDATFEAAASAASNSFPAGTDILVEDLETGRTTKARVVQRVEGRSDILVLLSPRAAEGLGLVQGDILRVRVTIRQQPSLPESALIEELAMSLPPREAGASAAEQPQPAESGASAGPSVAEATPAQPAAAEAPAAEAPAAEAAVPVEEAQGASVEDAALLAELASRDPQKRLFLPPREDELFAYQQPEAAVAEAVPPEGEATAETAPQIASVNGFEVHSPAVQSAPIELAEALPPRDEVPEIDQGLVAEIPALQTALETPLLEPEVLAVGPEQPKVALAAPAATAATVATPATTSSPTAADVAPATTGGAKPAPAASASLQGVYYLQLAAYADELLAKDVATGLAKTYPALVLEPEPGAKRLFRVLVGPLNKAESGTLLTYFRYRGFPDAFLRAAVAK